MLGTVAASSWTGWAAEGAARSRRAPASSDGATRRAAAVSVLAASLVPGVVLVVAILFALTPTGGYTVFTHEAMEADKADALAARDRLARELEDAAHADPVRVPDCLSPDRVRRLNRL